MARPDQELVDAETLRTCMIDAIEFMRRQPRMNMSMYILGSFTDEQLKLVELFINSFKSPLIADQCTSPKLDDL